MPNRILREGILTSERVNRLSPEAELFYRRLMSVADDYGRYDGRLSMLRVACYPLRVDQVSERDVSEWLRETQEAGLLRCYAVAGKPYLVLLDFRQQIRLRQSKWPAPEGESDADALRVLGECYADAPHAPEPASQMITIGGDGVGVGVGDGVGGGTAADPFAGLPDAVRAAIERLVATGMCRVRDWELAPVLRGQCKVHGEEIVCAAIADLLRRGGHVTINSLRGFIDRAAMERGNGNGQPTAAPWTPTPEQFAAVQAQIAENDRRLLEGRP